MSDESVIINQDGSPMPKNISQITAKPTERLPVDPASLPANPTQILALAVHNDVDVERMQALMTLEREYRADLAKAEFDQAAARFGALKKPIPHNRSGKTAGNAPFTYADYAQIEKHASPWAAECGLSWRHRQAMIEGQMYMVCILSHAAGHSEEAWFPVVQDDRLKGKVSPSQLLQLARTYAKRQTTTEVLGISTGDDHEDDDSVEPDKPGDSVKEHDNQQSKGAIATDKQVAFMGKKAAEKGVSIDDICHCYGVKDLTQIKKSDVNHVLEFIDNGGKK